MNEIIIKCVCKREKSTSFLQWFLNNQIILANGACKGERERKGEGEGKRKARKGTGGERKAKRKRETRKGFKATAKGTDKD